MVKVCSFCSSQSSFSLVRMTPSPVDLSSTTASKGTFCPWILKPQISPERHGKRPKESVLRTTERGAMLRGANKMKKQNHVNNKAIKSQTTKQKISQEVLGARGDCSRLGIGWLWREARSTVIWVSTGDRD